MLSLRTFAPWITYAAVSAVADWRLGAAIATVVAAREVRAQRALDGNVDDLARCTRWFFLALTALSLLSPESPLHRFTPALSLAALGLAAADSLWRDQPFTLTIARRSTPPEVWEHPAFLHTNVVITRLWAAAFLVSAALVAWTLAVAPHATALWASIEVLGFVVPVAATATVRNRARARFAASAVPSQPVQPTH